MDIPASVKMIYGGAFSGCSRLKVVGVIFEAGNHLRKIDRFKSCVSLGRIDIPESVTVIASRTFSECASSLEL
jgi:hypothetical protein